MRKLTVPLLTLFVSLVCFTGYGQSKITGQVVDEGDKTALQNANVMLLQAQDSILVDFSRADDSGYFSISKPDTTDVLLVVTYPKFGDYVQHISQGQQDVDLGELSLTSVAHLIEEVIVTGRIPVVIKGDTIEYDAGSYVVEKNAKVEDLLRVLPGITVDASGKITAQGKTVEKVLVDGEEFFGDDPTLVTRNIRSDMVDKIQVYEKQSDEAERTGVDDGERVQTINVTLREDAKNGMFGKVEAGVGTDGMYLGSAVANVFKGSQRIGAYGVVANNGTVSLGWGDQARFGVDDGASGVQITDDGGIMVFGSGGDEFSSWSGRGRPEAISTGVSFMDKWQEGKQRLNLNYKYGHIENNEISSTESQSNLVDMVMDQSSSSNRYYENQRHRFNSRYDWDIDSLTTLTVNVSGSRGQREGRNRNEATTIQDGVLTNENEVTQNTTALTSNVSYDGLVTRRFRKAGRSLSVRLAGNISEDDGEGLLQSRTEYFLQDNVEIIDQLKDINNTSNNVQTSITYTEPLSGKWRASLGYGYNNSRSHSINNSYNNDGNGVYNVFDEEYSNDFNFNTVRNFANLSIGFKADKLNFNLTNNIRNDGMYQRNNHLNADVQRGFWTYNPSLNVGYNIAKTKSLSLRYTRANSLPSLTQIQPLRQNTDPLNEVVGNEELTPSRSNNYNVGYHSFNLLKNISTYAMLGFSQTHNAIQSNVFTDRQSGKRTIFYDNISDHANNGIYLHAGIHSNLINKYSIQGRYGLSTNFNSGYNFLDGELNQNLNYSYSLSLSAEKNTTKNIDFSWGLSPGWRRLESSLQPENNSSGFTMGSNLRFKVFLPGKFQLYGDGQYTYEAATQMFDEKFERLMFTPGISKRFLKSEGLQVDLYVNDVFNQNIGFSRSQYAGMITQQNYNTISRYFMLKVSWDFTYMKTPE